MPSDFNNWYSCIIFFPVSFFPNLTSYDLLSLIQSKQIIYLTKSLDKRYLFTKWMDEG